MTLTIRRLHLPSAIDTEDAKEFLAWCTLRDAAWARLMGNNSADEDPALLLASRRDNTYSTRIDLVALRDEVIVGAGNLMLDNSQQDLAETEVSVLHDDDWAPVGDPLHKALLTVAREYGRSTISAWSGHAPTAREGSLQPPTEAGWVSHNAQASFLMRHGYQLEQVERHSSFDFPGDIALLKSIADEAIVFAGSDYRVAWWTGRTPDEYADGYARAVARMSTDVPSGDLTTEARTWTAERIHHRDDTMRRAGAIFGRTVVIHEPTGDVAAFNELQVGADRSKPTSQWGTLVMPEHRGHRLGTIVKAFGLLRWHEAVPQSPFVHTWNAEENRHMLSVNERVGFRALDYSGAWETKLTKD